MADLMGGTSDYASGSIDTATTQVNDDPTPISGEASAAKINGVATAIVQIEGVLGIATDLKGSKQDLVERLAVGHQANGDHKTLDVFEGGTGSALANMGKRLVGLDTTTLQFLDYDRLIAFTLNSTFTVPAGVTSFLVEVYGAGGGGGGGGGGSFDGGLGTGLNGGSGARGRPGGYAASIITGATPSGTYSITIGTAGAGGTGGGGVTGGAGGTGNTGGTGGTTSFAGLVTATGGAGGGGGTGGLAGTAAGTNASSETLADGAGGLGTITMRGRGAAPGAGGTGGLGTTSPTNGATGQAGQAGQVHIWY